MHGHRIQNMLHRIPKFCTMVRKSAHNLSLRSRIPAFSARCCYSVQTAVGGADFQYSVQHFLYSVADVSCMATEYRKCGTEYRNSAPWCGCPCRASVSGAEFQHVVQGPAIRCRLTGGAELQYSVQGSDLVQTAVGGADFQYSVQHFLYSVADFSCMATEYRTCCTEC